MKKLRITLEGKTYEVGVEVADGSVAAVAPVAAAPVAAPVAAAGFFQYNGLTLERFLWVWLKSEVIMAGKRVWRAENYYEKALKSEVKKH